MKGHKIASGSFANIDYETREYNGEHVHTITANGPIDIEHRIPVYKQTLENNPSENYFIIFDNRRSYEDNFAYDDMLVIAEILLKAGIKQIFGAIITKESGYDNIMKLARAVAKTKEMESQTVYAENMAEAEKFILSRIDDNSST
jgi:hypothetical protein